MQDPSPSSTCKFFVSKILPVQTFIFSYLVSLRLGIVKFTVPNEALVNYPAIINTITSSKTVTFSPYFKDIVQKPHNKSNHKAKPCYKLDVGFLILLN